MFVLPPGPPIRIGSQIYLHGLTCVIETPQYDIRMGRTWMNASPAHYGFIKGYIGADGDEVDCYVYDGSEPTGSLAYVVNQSKLDGSGNFDEHKVMLNYPSRTDALRDYFDGHTSAHKVFKSITPLTIPQLKKWLRYGDLSEPLE